MKNTIFLRRKNKVIVEAGQNELGPEYVLGLLKNIDRLGYAISEKLAERLSTLDEADFQVFHKQLVSDLKDITGMKVKFRPMYPNFPEQVRDTPLETLFDINALHYLGDWIGVRMLPDFPKNRRPKLDEETKIKVIDLGDDLEFEAMVQNLLSAKAVFSGQDKEDVSWCVHHHAIKIHSLLPEEMKNKENLAFVAGELMKHVEDADEIVARYVKTSTDVLRIATAMSEGDVSLSENTKYRSYKRSERRYLLGLLEACGSLPEDMSRHKNRWIRLGERLHPGEYKAQYPKAAEGFDIIRNDKSFETFNRILEKYFAAYDFVAAAEHLEKRPGEFARRLDHLLRSSADADSVLLRFENVADQVSTNVLLQLFAHFMQRDAESELRVFFPKGNTAKAFARPNYLMPIDEKTCAYVTGVIRDVLVKRFAELESLGDVYIDPTLKNYVVPMAQRAASKSLKTVARGTRFDIPEGNTIRFFLWWKEGMVLGKKTGRVDVDLSAVIYDENWGYREHISYTHLKSSQFNAYHSGDITSAPRGASEFIDLDINRALSVGARYVVMSLNSYTQHPFCNLPECFAGWMMRQKPNSGEIYEPRTLDQKIDVAADTTIAIPVILDLEERQFIWTDLALTRNPYWYNNVEGNQKGMVLLGQAMANLRKPNLYDLFEMHAMGRGRIVKNKDEAQTVFAVDEGITPFDTDDIMAKFL